MATKTILTQEQLDLLLSTYKEKGTFAAAGRAVGISSAVAKRIVSEHQNDTPTEDVPTVYTGPTPKENPTRSDIWNAFKKDEEWWKKYGE